MISLDCREYLIPLVPMEIPSDTAIVLNRIDLSPAFSTESEQILLNSSKCILHGFPDHQHEPTPTWPLEKSSVLKPVAYNCAREAPWDLDVVITEEYLLCFFNTFRVVRLVENCLLKILCAVGIISCFSYYNLWCVQAALIMFSLLSFLKGKQNVFKNC